LTVFGSFAADFAIGSAVAADEAAAAGGIAATEENGVRDSTEGMNQ
jgi:hypothetical protein